MSHNAKFARNEEKMGDGGNKNQSIWQKTMRVLLSQHNTVSKIHFSLSNSTVSLWMSEKG